MGEGDTKEHHKVIIVGGGPAGLALSVVLGGWHPHFSESVMLRQRYPQIADFLQRRTGSLLDLDMKALAASMSPVDLFRVLHHPRRLFETRDQVAMEFRRADPVDYLLLSQEEVGGLWNNAPRNLLTLSPGQWMEFAFYPLAQYAEEVGLDIDVNALISKTDLINYYHHIPERFEQRAAMRAQQRVTRIEPHAQGFLVTSRDLSRFADGDGRPTRRGPFPQPHTDLGDAQTHQFTCDHLVYATGQRSILRRLGVEGEDLPFVDVCYDKSADYEGERTLIVGGGRSADWAATELHDAGKQVTYAMRQDRERHWRLIDNSHHLPYYARIAEILKGRSPQLEVLYKTQIACIEAAGDGGIVTLATSGAERQIEVDHVIKEIGGWADYSLLEGFGDLQVVEKHDNYRFQVHQLKTHPHSCESIDIPNLYAGGYLAEGLEPVVISMHAATFAIAADILQKT